MGTTVEAFAFDALEGLSPGTLIAAEAEFIGDERGGQFQLSSLRLLD